MNNYSIKDIVGILSVEYAIQVKHPRPQGDTPEYLKHFNDNIWAYKIAHTVREGFTTITPEGEKYLVDVFVIYCDVIGIHPRTGKPLDGSEGDPETTYDEDYEDDDYES